ncbi:CdaR family transcriptional regulator [Listeria costaricensis]|uniref:CdaR family transcriptional regulator n=1 Tax=Listeria costaricensis TaxID=2026604 RepID=UPI000C07B59E|nr:sugar diacid recognition domain-containing protein [Listeria costaricensis]
MFPLNHRQAQQLVEKLMQDIPYSVNLMDEFGRIIASGDDRRLGELHAGALEAIRLGERVDIHENQPTVRKGTNLPIRLDDQIVGVVGITGEPEQVAPFCQIVSTMVVLLTEEAIRAAKEESARLSRDRLLEKLLFEEARLLADELRQLAELGIDPEQPIRFFCRTEKWPIEAPQIALQGEEWLLFWQGEAAAERQTGELCGTALSQNDERLKLAAQKAQTAFRIGRSLGLSGAVDYLDVGHLVNRDLTKEQYAFLQAIECAPELLETLKTYFRLNGEMKAISAALHIHRNTLLYRLDKIAAVTGKDPRNFMDLQLLITAWLSQETSIK